MTPTLPPLVFLGFVPALYAAIRRVRERLKLSEADLLTLFLLKKSTAESNGSKVLLLSDLLARLGIAMGYATSSRATDVVNHLKNKGFVEKKDLTDSERKQLFPDGSRAAAVFLTPNGGKKYDDFVNAMREAITAFVQQQPAGDQAALGVLLGTLQKSQQMILPLVEQALLDRPEGGDQPRFVAACKLYIGRDFTADHETRLMSWYAAKAQPLPPERLHKLVQELEHSAAGTPGGHKLRFRGGTNAKLNQLLQFLDRLILG